MVVPTDLHRIYTQTLLARRVMRQEVALELYARAVEICKLVNDDYEPVHPMNTQGLNGFLHEVSTFLEEVGMTISTGKEETGSGKGWVVLANTDSTDIALLATDYTPIEISYIRAVIQDIIESYPANSIGSTRALKLTSDLASTFPKSQAEQVLSSCVSRGWLQQSRRGRYSLAIRSLLELSMFLKDEYPDYIFTCQRCSKIVLTGVKCEADGCEAHIHESCLNSFKRHRGNVCPKCETSYDQVPPSPLGEKATSRETDHFRTGPSRRKGGRRSGANEEEEEEDDDDDEVDDELEEEEGEGMSQSQVETQTQGDGDEIDQSQGRRNGPRPTWRTKSRTSSRREVVPETQYDE